MSTLFSSLHPVSRLALAATLFILPACSKDDALACAGSGGSGGAATTGSAATTGNSTTGSAATTGSAMSYAPVPDVAKGVPIDQAKGYATEEISPGFHWITNGSSQAVFFVTTAGVIVIDAPPDLADGLKLAIAGVTSQPVTHLVYSHYHADHIGGAAKISATAQIVAHSATKKWLERANDPSRPVPTITFDDSYTLTVGGQTLELAYKGANHVEGNIFIYAPKQRALVLIDVVWPGWVPFTELGEVKDVPGYRAALDAALAYDFDTFIGGHVGRHGNKDDVKQTKAYVDDLFASAQQALTSVSIYDVGKKVGFENPYVLVDTWFGEMRTHCADAVRAKWVGKLGGADVWPESHCFIAFQSLRID